MHEFGVEDKIRGIVTDNASNMVKAFKQTEAAEVDENQQILTEDEDGLMRMSLDWRELQDQEEFDTIIPSRYGCLAHTLQLVVKDGLREGTGQVVYTLSYRNVHRLLGRFIDLVRLQN